MSEALGRDDSEMSVPGISLNLVRAGQEDLATVLDILEEARQWLLDRGIPEQWPAPMPPEVFADRIARGEVYLAYGGDDPQPIATFCLLPSDEKVWGDMPADGAYLHGLAVRRSAAGRNIGTLLLDMAGRLAAEMGRSYLRLDCWAGNLDLCRYYDRLGFQRKGRRDLGGGFVVQRYERPVPKV